MTVRALGESIFIEVDTMAELHEKVRDAVKCHFENGKAPKLIPLHKKFILFLGFAGQPFPPITDRKSIRTKLGDVAENLFGDKECSANHTPDRGRGKFLKTAEQVVQEFPKQAEARSYSNFDVQLSTHEKFDSAKCASA